MTIQLSQITKHVSVKIHYIFFSKSMISTHIMLIRYPDIQELQKHDFPLGRKISLNHKITLSISCVKCFLRNVIYSILFLFIWQPSNNKSGFKKFQQHLQIKCTVSKTWLPQRVLYANFETKTELKRKTSLHCTGPVIYDILK